MATPPTVLETRASRVSPRLIGLAVAVPALALLTLAAFLSPSSGGLGTHEQLGLPPCGWVAMMDIPCPTCGMTTAFAHAADGNLLASFRTQPMGAALALATAIACVTGFWVAATGAAVGPWLRRLWGPRTGWIVAAAIVVAWAYKIIAHRGGW